MDDLVEEEIKFDSLVQNCRQKFNHLETNKKIHFYIFLTLHLLQSSVRAEPSPQVGSH